VVRGEQRLPLPLHVSKTRLRRARGTHYIWKFN
jgi:hypothetical protein